MQIQVNQLAIIKIIYDSKKRKVDKAVLSILKILKEMLAIKKN